MHLVVAVFAFLVALILWKASQAFIEEKTGIQESLSQLQLTKEDPAYDAFLSEIRCYGFIAVCCAGGAWIAGGIAFAFLIYPFFLL